MVSLRKAVGLRCDRTPALAGGANSHEIEKDDMPENLTKKHNLLMRIKGVIFSRMF